MTQEYQLEKKYDFNEPLEKDEICTFDVMCTAENKQPQLCITGKVGMRDTSYSVNRTLLFRLPLYFSAHRQLCAGNIRSTP